MFPVIIGKNVRKPENPEHDFREIWMNSEKC